VLGKAPVESVLCFWLLCFLTACCCCVLFPCLPTDGYWPAVRARCPLHCTPVCHTAVWPYALLYGHSSTAAAAAATKLPTWLLGWLSCGPATAAATAAARWGRAGASQQLLALNRTGRTIYYDTKETSRNAEAASATGFPAAAWPLQSKALLLAESDATAPGKHQSAIIICMRADGERCQGAACPFVAERMPLGIPEMDSKCKSSW